MLEPMETDSIHHDTVQSGVHDDPDIPAWLTKEYMQKLLNNYYGQSSSFLKSIIVKKFGGKHNIFASDLYRVIVESDVSIEIVEFYLFYILSRNFRKAFTNLLF